MKLPWPKKKPTDKADQTNLIKPGSKEVAERLHQSGEDGTLVLTTDKLVKKYRQRTVANQVSIEVHQGEIVGLLGPNGAGKTTTFYMTTGLVAPNSGRVFLNDVDITTLPVYKR
ncbi:MAG: ATP-binding cassette domain-containing protein, partial [Muribaculaceae bacterium]|nr:ATP-binding cassette domain-containing protein [Muribaculaceae bacterium]